MRLHLIVAAALTLFSQAARADGPTAPRELLLDDDGATLARSGTLLTKLDAADFYRLVGRDDLVDKLLVNETRNRTNRAVGAMLLVAGSVVAVTGSLVGIGEALQWQKPSQTGILLAAGLGLGAAGVVLICLGQGDPQPLDLKARRALIEEYNARVTSEAAAPRHAAPPIVNLSLQPLAIGGVRGIGLSGSF